MRDRLAELKKASPDAPALEVQTSAQAADVEKGSAPPTPMKTFFDEISNMRGAINTIKKLVTDVEETHGKALTAVSEEQGADHAKAIDEFMDQINMQAGIVRRKLKDMEKVNQDFEKKNPNSSDARIRASQHAVLVKKFTDTMTEYNEVQNKFKGKYKQRLQKQFLIVKPDASPDEVEKVVNGEGGAAIFAQQIMPGAQYMEAKQALQDIQERHQDIIKIEKSILELHQLFVDMSVLVAQQGELLNQIDSHVSKAVEYTEQGVEELKEANVIQKKSRKRMCILIFCLVVLAVVIGVGASIPKILSGH
ncbi:t-SNARE [Blastocladiella britannica]|nr:t-SNARE [Blastocladiella britannica]